MRTFLILLSALSISWLTASAQHYSPEVRDPGAKYPIDTCRLCVTYDFDSEEDHAVTVRDRDTMEQVRIPIAELKSYFEEKLSF